MFVLHNTSARLPIPFIPAPWRQALKTLCTSFRGAASMSVLASTLKPVMKLSKCEPNLQLVHATFDQAPATFQSAMWNVL